MHSSKGSSVKLHLGCFDHVFEGWINTDITLHIFISRAPGLAALLSAFGLISPDRYQQYKQGIFRKVKYLDATGRFPWTDNFFSIIYTSHMLQNLHEADAINCLKECYRVLAPGGLVRIAVPDLDTLIRSYDPKNPEEFLTKFFEARQEKDKNRHHWHYNENSLRRILSGIGFQSITRCEYRQGRCPELETIEERPPSLFMEAVK